MILVSKIHTTFKLYWVILERKYFVKLRDSLLISTHVRGKSPQGLFEKKSLKIRMILNSGKRKEMLKTIPNP